MSPEQLPESLWSLADPAQEVLVEARPVFTQQAPVPLRRLGAQPVVAAESYRPRTEQPRD